MTYEQQGGEQCATDHEADDDEGFTQPPLASRGTLGVQLLATPFEVFEVVLQSRAIITRGIGPLVHGLPPGLGRAGTGPCSRSCALSKAQSRGAVSGASRRTIDRCYRGG
jgi:hypothetical protein